MHGPDVVVPVYNAVDDLERCVESVLAHTPQPHTLVLIDDASPDPRVAVYFEALARRALPHVVLLRNERNLGFTGTANRGMERSRADVVLLNSDTVVTEGWLEALLRCAASDSTIGTATPFSNNAEICSYPRFCEDNPWDGGDPEPVRAALARAAVPTYPDLPTGVGFCMLVCRAMLDAVGTFDPVFGRGYGEENDLCMRAAAAGWRNVLCDDAYVLHLGGRSFAGAKTELGARNLRVLLDRHPAYQMLVSEFIARDPLRPLREAARARQRASDGRHGVLHVIHGHGGGTEHHVRALIASSRAAYRHYLVVAVGDRWQVEEHDDAGDSRSFMLERAPHEPWDAFVGGLCATLAIDLLHLHNISGARDGILKAAAHLGIPYGYTVHDLNFACPTITFLTPHGVYCGSVTDDRSCAQCLAQQPDFAEVAIGRWRAQHRALLERAAFVIAPSRWAAEQATRYFPGLEVGVVPHATPGDALAAPAAPRADGAPRMAAVLPADGVPTVAVLGAIGPDKGARRLERLVDLARAREARVRFVLIGYLDREHGPWQSGDAVFTIHGRYHPRDLPDLLAHYGARLVLYPSAGPETFSFTLSEAWAAGRPVVVPPFGALAERVRAHGGGWIWSADEWSREEGMLDHLLQLLADPVEIARVASRTRGIVLPSPSTMARGTTHAYERAWRAAPASPNPHPPFAPARMRDALGYAPWSAPRGVPAMAQSGSDTTPEHALQGPPAVVHQPGFAPWLARLGLRMRHTVLGRVLHAVVPAPIVDALKSRLR